MDANPKTVAELKGWLDAQKVDPKQFALGSAEPDWGGYYIFEVPGYWTINVKDWPIDNVLVRCDTESQVCECFVEVVNGEDQFETSLTSRLRREMNERIEKSWNP